MIEMSVTVRFFDTCGRLMKKDDYERVARFGQVWSDGYVFTKREWKDFYWRWMDRREDPEWNLDMNGIQAMVLYMRLMSFLSWHCFPISYGYPGWWYIEKEKYRIVESAEIRTT